MLERKRGHLSTGKRYLFPECVATPFTHRSPSRGITVHDRWNTQLAARLTDNEEAGLLLAQFDRQFVVPVIGTYLQGLWQMALVFYDRSQVERQINVFLTGLGL